MGTAPRSVLPTARAILGIVQVFTATFTMQIVDGRIDRTWRNAADLQRMLQLGARILPPA